MTGFISTELQLITSYEYNYVYLLYLEMFDVKTGK